MRTVMIFSLLAVFAIIYSSLFDRIFFNRTIRVELVDNVKNERFDCSGHVMRDWNS